MVHWSRKGDTDQISGQKMLSLSLTNSLNWRLLGLLPGVQPLEKYAICFGLHRVTAASGNRSTRFTSSSITNMRKQRAKIGASWMTRFYINHKIFQWLWSFSTAKARYPLQTCSNRGSNLLNWIFTWSIGPLLRLSWLGSQQLKHVSEWVTWSDSE